VTIVFFAYAVITTDKAELFIESSQLDDAAREYLKDIVNIQPYDAFFGYLKTLPGQLNLTEESVRPSCFRDILSLITFFFSHRFLFRQKILVGDKASLAVAEAIGEVGSSIF
jgi:Xaa-Pro aminopeptidase